MIRFSIWKLATEMEGLMMKHAMCVDICTQAIIQSLHKLVNYTFDSGQNDSDETGICFIMFHPQNGI